MDPFSITVGAVGLADAGTSLAGYLTDKYKSYRDAPELILEIAHEVEFCAGLVDLFASNIDRSGSQQPKRFVKDAQGLVGRTQQIFNDIRVLIPEERDFDATFSKARWRFVLDKKKLTQHQQRLRQSQQMFMFMETMHRYHYPSSGQGTGTSAAGSMSVNGSRDPNASSNSQEQSLTGILASQTPIQATGVGPDGQTFQVTLTLKPVEEAKKRVRGTEPKSVFGIPESRSGLPSHERIKDNHGTKMLEGLRRSPFFDLSLLAGRKETHFASAEPVKLEDEIVVVEPRSHFHNKPEAESMFRRKEAEEERMRKKEDREDGARLGVGVVDDDTAKEDVDDLRRLWFGSSEDESDSDSLNVPSSDDQAATKLEPFPPSPADSSMGYSVEETIAPPYRSPARTKPSVPPFIEDLDPPSISPTRSPSGTVTLPTHPGPSARSPNGRSQGSYTRITCDRCNRRIRSGSPRMQCRNCQPSFDLCAHCFADPEMTLRHRHPKSYFLRSTVG